MSAARMGRRTVLRIAALAVALTVAIGATGLLRAHGYGTPQVLNAPTGPYTLSIWTDPEPLREDETHVVVAVIDPLTQELIVSEVVVSVRMQSDANPEIVLQEVAGPDSTNRLLFAAEFNHQVTAGSWLVGVSANGAAGSGSEVTFPVEITPRRGFNWLWIGAVSLVLLVLVWVFLSLRSGKTRTTSTPSRRDKL
jgi:hypothetical protein